MVTAKKKPAAKAPAPVASKKPAAKAAKVDAKASTPKTRTKPVAAPVAAPAGALKEKKIKMVRDSFTMPKPEFLILDVLKLRAAKLGAPVKKTELIRAGIKALAAMSDSALLAAIRAVPSLKTGRPAKHG